MVINILTVGKLKEDFYRNAAGEYIKRLGRFAKVNVIELPEVLMRDGGAKDIDRIILEESSMIAAKMRGTTVALDLSGRMVSSEDIATFLHDTAVMGSSEITFIIGGSHGMTRDLVARCNATFCFGKITFPHQLMRVVVLEQVYRGFMIINNSDYHK